MSEAFFSARFSTYRGSAKDGAPSGRRMSQNIRAVPWVAPRQGSSWNVDGSGWATMSDSYTRAKPWMADPSNPIPSESAPSSSAGATATDFRKPRTSVNQSRTKRTSRSSMVRSTNSVCLSMQPSLPLEVFQSGYTVLPDTPGTLRRRLRRVRPAVAAGAPAHPG